MGQALDLTEQLYVHETQLERVLGRLEDLRLRAIEPQNDESARKLREEMVRENAQLMHHQIAIALLRSRIPDTESSARGRQHSVDVALRRSWVIGGKLYK